MKITPYMQLMRWDKPIGYWLLYWPCAWGVMATAAPWQDKIFWLAALLFGAIVMRGAGCVWNDFLDRDIDKQVARTRSRPLAAGTISPRAALVFMGLLLCGGLGIALLLPPPALLTALTVLPLVALYPLMKRFFILPQLWLGIVFNWGALVGYATLAGTLDQTAWVLWLAGLFWTVGYDTIYALQDIADDTKLGLHSAARLWGASYSRYAVAFCYLVSLILLATLLAGWQIALLLPTVALAAWQALTMRPEDNANLLRRFKSNTWFGLLVTLSLAAV